MNYKIVSFTGNYDAEYCLKQLELLVLNEIKNGFKPHGNVVTTIKPFTDDSGQYTYYDITASQPMVKED